MMVRRRISELIDEGAIVEMQDGNHGEKHPTSKDYVDEGIPFLMARDFTGSEVDLQNACKISKELADSLRIGFARSGDVLLTHKGTIGSVAIVPNVPDYVMLTPQVTYYRTNPRQLLNKYLKYAFQAPHFRHQLDSYSAQSTRPYIGITAQRQLKIDYPPLPVQRRIAGILSAYDELIENHQRRIKILEEMARSLYREWFVHFRFPGYGKVKMVSSPLGPIPQGWEVMKLKDVTSKIGSGATPRGGREAYKTEGIRLIRSLNVYDYQFEFSGLAFIDEAQAAELDNVTVAARDILLNITGASVARCCMVPSYLMPARVNQHVAIVRTDQGRADPCYVLDSINSEQRKQQLLAFAQGGATREALTKETIENFPIMLPPRPLLDKYGRYAGALHAQRETLERQCQNLRRTRDLLLPRLLSGQIVLEEN